MGRSPPTVPRPPPGELVNTQSITHADRSDRHRRHTGTDSGDCRRGYGSRHRFRIEPAGTALQPASAQLVGRRDRGGH
uniref:Uncharacterized protein n=1 Tax=uncultured marine virus TaxID=186617 RepID=A0A0F7L797_9VIRU|nr:hypothetical protein [uncultured marine virus]